MKRDGRRTTLPEPWRRVDPYRGKLGSIYAHPAGYTIKHCGHPTAIWPYGLYDQGGDFIPAPNGRAFSSLAAAAAAAEARIAEDQWHEVRRAEKRPDSSDR